MLRSGGGFGRLFQVWGFAWLVGSAAFAQSAAPAAPAVLWERIDAGLSHMAAGDGKAAEKAFEAARKGDDSGLAEVLLQLTRAYVDFNNSKYGLRRSIEANERLDAANKDFYHQPIPPAILGEALARVRKLLKERPATEPSPVLLRPLLCNLRLLARDHATDGEQVLEYRGPSSKDMESLVPPRPVFAPLPPFTEAARESKTSGSAVLEVILDSEGCPASAKVLKPLPKRLSDQAVTTWKWWAYEPARYQGALVGYKQVVTFNFAVQ